MVYLKQLAKFSKMMKAQPRMGRFIGIDLPERDSILKEEFEKFEAKLLEASAAAKKSQKSVEVDASGISMTQGGDICEAKPDGTFGRKLSIYPGFGDFLKKSSTLRFMEDAEPDRTIVFKAAFNGLWSPNATNWQPIRLIEVNSDIIKSLPGVPATLSDDALGILFLRRNHYESLLGDVLEPFGFQVTAMEEFIDCGIFKQVFKLTLASRNRGWVSCEINEENVNRLSERLVGDLNERETFYRQALDETGLTSDTGELLKLEISKIEELRSSLKSETMIPDEVFIIGGRDTASRVEFDSFDEIVINRRSERVAAPNKLIPEKSISNLLTTAMESLDEDEMKLMQVVYFDKGKEVPIQIGEAMFFALYGNGADPVTKKGGIGGFIPGMTLGNFFKVLIKRFPGEVEGLTPEKIDALDVKELTKIAKSMAVKSKYLGKDMLARILRDGKYSIKDGFIINDRGSALSAMLLVRLMATMASTFGNFFLKFQNTHPYTFFLLAKSGATPDETRKVYNAVGKITAVLALHTRAMGFSSIVKTGPIDLAREKITKIMINCMSDRKELAGTALKLKNGEMTPALFFQVGHPLSGSDPVDEGEHNGFDERKKDKRPPRKDSTLHYVALIK